MLDALRKTEMIMARTMSRTHLDVRMIYVKSLALAALVISVGAVFVWLTFRSTENKIRDSFRQQKAAGTLPPDFQDVDIETIDISKVGFQMKLPRAYELRLQIAMWIVDLWYLWSALTVGICLGVAALARRWRTRG